MEERPCGDGSVDRCHANIVAENIHSRIDSEECSQCMLDETLDHKPPRDRRQHWKTHQMNLLFCFQAEEIRRLWVQTTGTVEQCPTCEGCQFGLGMSAPRAMASAGGSNSIIFGRFVTKVGTRVIVQHPQLV